MGGRCPGAQDLDINGDGFGGDLTDVLFAITTNGDIYAIDTDLNNGTGGLITSVPSKIPGDPAVNLFPGGANHISTGLHNVQGLAFSPVDFNPWHPTTLGATDPGHGIDAAPDNSRNLGIVDTGTGTTAVAGGGSYYFGLEDYETNSPATAPFHYLSYPQLTFYDSVNGLINGALPGAPNAQYGMQSATEQQALTAYNAGEWPIPAQVVANGIQDLLIGNNTNAPGGTQGNLVTDSFSLAGYSPTDLPTLYFNYMLGAGWNPSTNSGADIAKVSVSTDGGSTWTVIASNQSADMAKYQSVFSNTGSGNALQGNQFLFNAPLANPSEPTGGYVNTWRKARVDLSQFAGASNVKLEFSYTATSDNLNSHGFAVDDIIVGVASRGEMVTQAPATLNTATDPTTLNSITSFFTVPQNPNLAAPTQTLVGAYELSIRRGQEYATTQIGILDNIAIDQSKLILGSDRLETNYSLLAPGMVEMDLNSFVLAGEIAGLNAAGTLPQFTIADGLGGTRTFQLSSTAIPVNTTDPAAIIADFIAGPVASGSIGIPFTSLNQDADVPLTAVQLQTLNQTIVNTINAQTSATFRVRAVLDPSGKIFLIPTTVTSAAVTVNLNSFASLLLNKTPQITSGDKFSLSDGFYTRIFEFVPTGTAANDGQILPDGNVAILFSSTDSPTTVATNMLKAINSQTSAVFAVSASIQGWTGSGARQAARSRAIRSTCSGRKRSSRFRSARTRWESHRSSTTPVAT